MSQLDEKSINLKQFHVEIVVPYSVNAHVSSLMAVMIEGNKSVHHL